MKYIYNEEDFKMSVHGRSFMQVIEKIVPDSKLSNTHFIMHETLQGYIVSIFKSQDQIDGAGEVFTTHYTAPRVTPEDMEKILRTGLVRWINAGTTGTMYNEEFPTLNIAFKKEL